EGRHERTFTGLRVAGVAPVDMGALGSEARVELVFKTSPVAEGEDVISAVVERPDSCNGSRRPSKVMRACRAVPKLNQDIGFEEGRGPPPHERQFPMSLLERFRQADVEEKAFERAARDRAARDESGKDLLLERTRQFADEIHDLTLEHINSTVDDA